MQHAVQVDKRKTCHQVPAECSISTGSAHNALKKHLKLCKKSADWIPHLLTTAQKLHRVNTVRRSLQLLRQWNWAGPLHIITGDESWFWTWMLESKQSSCQWLRRGAQGEGRCPTKVQTEHVIKKSMLVDHYPIRLRRCIQSCREYFEGY